MEQFGEAALLIAPITLDPLIVTISTFWGWKQKTMNDEKRVGTEKYLKLLPLGDDGVSAGISSCFPNPRLDAIRSGCTRCPLDERRSILESMFIFFNQIPARCPRRTVRVPSSKASRCTTSFLRALPHAYTFCSSSFMDTPSILTHRMLGHTQARTLWVPFRGAWDKYSDMEDIRRNEIP